MLAGGEPFSERHLAQLRRLPGLRRAAIGWREDRLSREHVEDVRILREQLQQLYGLEVDQVNNTSSTRKETETQTLRVQEGQSHAPRGIADGKVQPEADA